MHKAMEFMKKMRSLTSFNLSRGYLFPSRVRVRDIKRE